MKQRSMIQKILMVIAITSYIVAIGCGIAAGYLSDGSANPVVASMMASVVFFAGVGIVLHVIGSTNLPSLKVGRGRA
jgi:hypothetical protein